jgi:hypothetical protein
MDRAATTQALRDLRYDWGTAYIITADTRWMAMRRHNGHVLVADSPDDLRDLMRDDYSADPVRRGLDSGDDYA